MNKTKSRVLMPRLGFSVLIDIFSHVIDSVIYFFWSCSTSLVKFFLRKCTGLCELQRICYKTEKGAQRSLAVEKCINSSRREVVTRIREKLDELAQNVRFNSTNTSEVIQSVEHAVAAICIEKAIKPSIHPDFMIAMRICFLQIYGYKNLVHEIESLRSIVYDSSDPEHEKKLKSLWESLSPDNPLKERKSRQWTEIGFQGDDPMTDFRGMGLLGLENLLFLSRNHNKTAKLILLHSSHPSYGFPFAITGINITHIAYNLLKSGELKTHFFNSIFGTTCLDDFHKVYCYLFYMFDQLWMSEKPKDVMEFSHIREKFLVSVREKLAKFDTILVFNPPVEDV